MLVATIPQNQARYFRGLNGLLRGLHVTRRRRLLSGYLGQIDTVDVNQPQSVSPDLATLLAEANYNQTPPIVSSDVSQAYVPPPDIGPIISSGSPAQLSVPGPAQPANTVLNAQGMAVPKPGYTLGPSGQVVPSAATSISNWFAANKNLVVFGGIGVVALSLLTKKKRR